MATLPTALVTVAATGRLRQLQEGWQLQQAPHHQILCLPCHLTRVEGALAAAVVAGSQHEDNSLLDHGPLCP